MTIPGKLIPVISGKDLVRSGADLVRSTNFSNHSIYEGYFSLLSVVSINKVSYPYYPSVLCEMFCTFSVSSALFPMISLTLYQWDLALVLVWGYVEPHFVTLF